MFVSLRAATRIAKRARVAAHLGAVLLGSAPAVARQRGLAVSDCSGCHSGLGEPTLELEFEPATPEPGVLVTLKLRISLSNSNSAGFFLEAPALGQLQAIAGQPTSVSDAGATHSTPIESEAGSAQVQLQWRAPNEPGGVVFEVAAVAANGNGQSNGDSAAYGQFGLVWGCGEGITLYRDNDADGFGAESFGKAPGCAARAGWVEQSGDCDENAIGVHPGATEICNEKDDDCDGQTDEGTTPRLVYLDADGDGFGARGGPSTQACALPAGYADSDDDCDDANIEAHPGALEVCNGLDDNCDDRSDEGARERCGVGWCERLAPSCERNACVPGEPSEELCNGVDDDCDGQTDEQAPCPAGSTCQAATCQQDDASAPVPSGTASVPPAPEPAGPMGSTPTSPGRDSEPSTSAPSGDALSSSTPTTTPIASAAGGSADPGSGDFPPTTGGSHATRAPNDEPSAVGAQGACDLTARRSPSALWAWTLGLATMLRQRRRRLQSIRAKQ